MHPLARPLPRRPSRLLIVAAIVAAILVCAVAFWRPWAVSSPPVAGTAGQDAAAPAPIAIPEHPRVLVFGDSWTFGSAASAPTRGFAYVIAERLGWDRVIDGVRGSGYLKPGIDGGTYGERIALLDPELDPDLVIVEGSINDRRLPAAGYRDAVTAAWDELAALYPEAAIVILGPAPQVLPVERATARIDRDLAALAAGRDWWYISPITEDWITEANYLDVIDTSDVGRNHPSTEGHAYLADRLADALAAMSTGAEITAAGDAPAAVIPSIGTPP